MRVSSKSRKELLPSELAFSGHLNKLATSICCLCCRCSPTSVKVFLHKGKHTAGQHGEKNYDPLSLREVTKNISGSTDARNIFNISSMDLQICKIQSNLGAKIEENKEHLFVWFEPPRVSCDAPAWSCLFPWLKGTPNSSASNKPQDHPSCNTQEPWSPWARPPIHHLWSTNIGLSGYCGVIHESFMSLLGHLEKKSRVQTFVFFTPMKVIQAMGFPGTRVVKPRCLYDWCSSSAGFHWHAHC